MQYNFDAKLFEIAHRFVSKDETRYYLHGVYVEPCASGGVAIVATDGLRMFVSYDPAGSIERPAILKADKSTLSACKKADRIVRTDGEHADLLKDGRVCGVSLLLEVDGTFPDYQRVIPQTEGETVGIYSPKLIEEFAKAARDLAKVPGAKSLDGHFTIKAEDEMMPALVSFAHENAFGVLMPLRGATSSPLAVLQKINAQPSEGDAALTQAA